MADPIGEFRSTRAAWFMTKTADGEIQMTTSYEGTADGFGAVFGTLTRTQPLAEAGASSGTCSYAGLAVNDDGSIIGGIGEGTWERIGSEMRSSVSLLVELSDGSKLRSEGVVDPTEQSWNGKIYET